MDFDFKEEQLQLADAVAAGSGATTVSTRAAIVDSRAGTSDRAWATLAELGLTALPVPEEQGGFAGDALDMFVVMQELGRGLVVEPYFATVLGAEFLRWAAARRLLERVAGGRAETGLRAGRAPVAPRHARHRHHARRGGGRRLAHWTAKRRWCCTAPRPAC
jgi:alkylation response protein AidB-like acyl-CoA dehydrogenase